MREQKCECREIRRIWKSCFQLLSGFEEPSCGLNSAERPSCANTSEFCPIKRWSASLCWKSPENGMNATDSRWPLRTLCPPAAPGVASVWTEWICTSSGRAKENTASCCCLVLWVNMDSGMVAHGGQGLSPTGLYHRKQSDRFWTSAEVSE